jgi:hypothetical protein
MRVIELDEAKAALEAIRVLEHCIDEMEYILLNRKSAACKFAVRGCNWAGWEMTTEEIVVWVEQRKLKAEAALTIARNHFEAL